jgi:hypothetical protein
MTSNGIEATEKTQAICPSWEWLSKTCSDNGRPNNDYWNYFTIVRLFLTIHFKNEKLFRHSFGVAIIVWEITNNGFLSIQDIFLRHVVDSLKLIVPIMLYLIGVKSFINKSSPVGNGE